MSLNLLLTEISKSNKAGGSVYDTAELAYMLGKTVDPTFTKFLSDAVKKGSLVRVCKGIYYSALTPPDLSNILLETAKKLRANVFSYISLESQLSHTGDISQIIMDRLTIMTKGRKANIETAFGVIEFVHTKKPLSKLEALVYFDPEIKMFRATTELAITDLKACRRNTHMLEYA
ncbi:hypothetical protein [uncultured Psychrosphaera sp.]|uniref:type IV toxin-antitoxin system AbiEi family antitoxin n=1 Tax=uncultured Psychrosphaera sp. TaxID=1403522 RepID=UPI00262AB247|nr:hypothetical protein [uncultured Psychrosphaera sp.]